MSYLPKDYVSVSTRVEKFHEKYPNGSIQTTFSLDGDIAIFTAKITATLTDGNIKTFTGHSFGKLGKEKAFEKLETVAVGRALAFMGFETTGGIASREEMEIFEENEAETPTKWLNYEDLLALSEAGIATEEQMKQVIQQDGYKLSKNAKIAVRHYVDTGEIDKNLFFGK